VVLQLQFEGDCEMSVRIKSKYELGFKPAGSDQPSNQMNSVRLASDRMNHGDKGGTAGHRRQRRKAESRFPSRSRDEKAERIRYRERASRVVRHHLVALRSQRGRGAIDRAYRARVEGPGNSGCQTCPAGSGRRSRARLQNA
jgi:hypothetical protein